MLCCPFMVMETIRRCLATQLTRLIIEAIKPDNNLTNHVDESTYPLHPSFWDRKALVYTTLFTESSKPPHLVETLYLFCRFKDSNATSSSLRLNSHWRPTCIRSYTCATISSNISKGGKRARIVAASNETVLYSRTILIVKCHMYLSKLDHKGSLYNATDREIIA